MSDKTTTPPSTSITIKAVVFDLDGLMFNTEDVFNASGRELLKRRGHVMTPEILSQMMGRRAEEAFAILIEMLNLTETIPELLAESQKIFDSLLESALAPMPGLFHLLDHIENARLPKAVATSSGRTYLEGILSRFELLERFPLTLTAEDVTKGKPHPEIYLSAANRLGVEPPEMLVLEDSEAGTRAAAAAGAVAISVPHEHSRAHDFTVAHYVAETGKSMRILYGAFAQGQGHFSKAAVLVPILERYGHDVRVISSGCAKPPTGYRFTWHQHFPGLSYAVTNGRPDYRRTFSKWLRELPRVARHLWTLRKMVREFQPDFVISDFEPLSASPLIRPRCEVVAISRQVTLFDHSIPLPPDDNETHRRLTRSVIRLFTAGADRLYGYHYEPASFRCVPPIIRPDLHRVAPEEGDHVVVYNHYDTAESGSPDKLIEWSKRRKVEVRAYGFPKMPRENVGGVRFRPPGQAEMLDDMRTARAVITSAGLSTPLEAFLLQKPVGVVPIPRHWEQHVNAFHLREAQMANASKLWDYDHLLETAVPAADHPLGAWLRTPAERVLAHILPDGFLPGPDKSTPKPPPTSADRTAA
eukprot:g21918.t1